MLVPGEIELIYAGINTVLRFGTGIQNLVTQKVVKEKVVLPRPKKETNWLVVEDYFQNEGKSLVRPGGLYYEAWQGKDIPETAETSIETLIDAYDGIIGAKSIVHVFKNSPEFQKTFNYVNEQQQYAAIATLFKVEEKKKDSTFSNIFNLTMSIVRDNAPLFFQDNSAASQAVLSFLRAFPTDVTAFTKEDIFRSLLDTTLKVAADNASLFLSDNKFGSILKAVLNHASDTITTTTQGNYLKELLQSTIYGVSQTTGLFIHSTVLEDVVKSILDVASVNLQQDSLFRTKTLTDIVQTTLDSISRNTQLIAGGENAASMILGSILKVANQDPSKLLNPNKALFADILKTSLETIGKNTNLFFKKNDIVSQVLSSVLQGVAQNPNVTVSPDLFKQLFISSLNEALRNLQLVLAKQSADVQQPPVSLDRASRGDSLSPALSSTNIVMQSVNAILKATSGAVAQFISEDQKAQITQSAFTLVSRNSAIFDRYTMLFSEVLMTSLESIYRDSNRLAAGALLIDVVQLALLTAAKNPRLYNQEKWLLPTILDSVLQVAGQDRSGVIRGDLLVDFMRAALEGVSLRPKPFLANSRLLSRILGETIQASSESAQDLITGENLVRAFKLALEAVSKQPDLLDRKKDFNTLVASTIVA